MTMNRKVLAGVGLATAAALAGGSYSAFTATADTGTQTIASGTVAVATQGGTFSTDISNIAPGDVNTRTIQLVNSGTIAWGTVKMSPVKDASTWKTLLTTGDDGVSVKVTRTDNGQVLVPSTKLKDLAADTNIPLYDLKKDAGAVTDLDFEYTFASAADNTYQNLTDAVKFKFDVVQRNAGTFTVSPDGSVDGMAGTVSADN